MFILVVTNRILYQTLIYHLSPNVKMHILITVLHTFLMELVRRICLNIKTTYPWWYLLLLPWITWMFEQEVIIKRGISLLDQTCKSWKYRKWSPRENVLIFKQILPANIIRNVWRTVRRIYMLILGLQRIINFVFIHVNSRATEGLKVWYLLSGL